MNPDNNAPALDSVESTTLEEDVPVEPVDFLSTEKQQPATSPSKPVKVRNPQKTIHLCHPKEWIAVAVLLVAVVLSRSFIYWDDLDATETFSAFDAKDFDRNDISDNIAYADSVGQAPHLVKSYCQLDLDVLCGRYSTFGNVCAESLGSPLAFLYSEDESLLTCAGEINDPFVWEMLRVNPQNQENLMVEKSLGFRVPGNLSVDERFHVEVNWHHHDPSYSTGSGPLVDENGECDDSTNWLAHLTLLSFQKVWSRYGINFMKNSTHTSSDMFDRIISFYVYTLTNLFSGKFDDNGIQTGTSMSVQMSINDRSWAPDDIFAIMRWSVHTLDDKRAVFDETSPEFYSDFLPRVMRIVNTTQNSTEAYHWGKKFYFRYPEPVHSQFYSTPHFPTLYERKCMLSQIAHGHLITTKCGEAITAASQLDTTFELEEGGGFMFFVHFLSYAGNVFLFLMLLLLKTRKRQHVKGLERGRRRLFQALDDPFLRSSMEASVRKALPESQHEHFMTKLTLKARGSAGEGTDGTNKYVPTSSNKMSGKWDINAIASRRLRRDVRFYWIAVLIYMALVTVAFFVEMAAGVLTFKRWLEIIMLALICYGAPLVIDFDQLIEISEDLSATNEV